MARYGGFVGPYARVCRCVWLCALSPKLKKKVDVIWRCAHARSHAISLTLFTWPCDNNMQQTNDEQIVDSLAPAPAPALPLRRFPNPFARFFYWILALDARHRFANVRILSNRFFWHLFEPKLRRQSVARRECLHVKPNANHHLSTGCGLTHEKKNFSDKSDNNSINVIAQSYPRSAEQNQNSFHSN